MELKGHLEFNPQARPETPTGDEALLYFDEDLRKLVCLQREGESEIGGGEEPPVPPVPPVYDEETHSYGVEIDVTISSPELPRIGNLDLHRTLPIQSKMRGCLIDGTTGAFIKYLNPTDWTSEPRNGSVGQVMVEIPAHYRKFTTDGNKRQVRISEYPLPNYHLVSKRYVSAYEASVSSGLLCSVAGTTPSMSTSRAQFRNYARARGAGTQWNCYDYNTHKAIVWLYYIEYANLDSQAPFTIQKDINGFAQGGLGVGVGRPNNWAALGNLPFFPTGQSDGLGNGSGSNPYTIPGDGKVVYAARYRGIENIFGHIWKIIDGVNIENSTVYVADDPALFSDVNSNGYFPQGVAASGSGYTKEMIFGTLGEIIPSVNSGGSTTTFWCDYSWATAGSMRCLAIGSSSATNERDVGLNYTCINRSPDDISYAFSSCTRLCFIPQDN